VLVCTAYSKHHVDYDSPISLAKNALRALVQAFISFNDYCKDLMARTVDAVMIWLQTVQKTPAHLVLGTWEYDATMLILQAS